MQVKWGLLLAMFVRWEVRMCRQDDGSLEKLFVRWSDEIYVVSTQKQVRYACHHVRALTIQCLCCYFTRVHCTELSSTVR